MIAVDKTAQLCKNEYDIADAYKYSMHLLKDGLLIITYDKTDGNIVVKDKIFSEDFIFDYFSLFNFTDEQFALMEERIFIWSNTGRLKSSRRTTRRRPGAGHAMQNV